LGYQGVLSIEYFDRPERGWPLADPLAYALELASRLRAIP